jgi:hypothetical protein
MKAVRIWKLSQLAVVYSKFDNLNELNNPLTEKRPFILRDTKANIRPEMKCREIKALKVQAGI